MILRRFLLLPAVAAATMTVLSPSAAFAASASGVDVTSIRIANIHVASGNCKHTPVTASWTTDGWYSVDGIDYEVWKGSHYVEADDMMFDSDYAGGPNSGAGDYYYCPYLDGLGSFTVRSLNVEWSYQYEDDSTYTYDYDSGNVASDTTTSFVAKQAARLPMSVTRAGGVTTIAGKVRYYSVNASGWVAARYARVQLQSSRSATGPWRTVATQTATKAGAASFRRSVSPRYWRLRYGGNSVIWAQAASPVRR